MPSLRAEGFWRDVVDRLGEGVLVRDSSGRIVYVNRAAEQILQLDGAQLLEIDPGQRIGLNDPVHEDGTPFPFHETPTARALRTNTPVRDVVMGVDLPGQGRRWIWSTATPIQRAGDEDTFVVTMFMDVTDRRDAEVAMLDAEERFKSAVSSMLDGFAMYTAMRDEHGVVTDFMCDYVNRSSLDNRGLTPDEQVGHSMLEVLPNLRDLGLFDRFVRVVETGEPMVLDLPWYESERVKGSFELRAVKLGDGIAVSFRDVTDRRFAERDLRQSEARLQALFSALPVGVALVDAGGMLLTNPVAEKLLGKGPVRRVEADELTRFYGLYVEGTDTPYPIEQLPLRRAMEHGETSSATDVVIRRPDGDIPVETFASPITNEDGVITHAVTVFSDVTERRKREAALARALTELQRSNEALSEFAAVAAHDLAEPLRGITGFVELLRTRYPDLPPDAHDWIDHAMDGASSMRRLIDDLLAFSRSGAGEPPDQDVQLETVVRDACRLLHAPLTESGAVVEVCPLPSVRGDRTQLEQMFQNLIANAVKFTTDGATPHITIDALREEDHWRVQVTDRGIGVPEHERERVFDPLHRAHAHDVQGSGLGLAICRQIASRHGGQIWVEPGPGNVGSRFCVTFPALDAAEDA